MTRHPCLDPLSREHHHGLVHALRLRRAADEQDPRVRIAAARLFADFFSREVLPHFQAEEEGVFRLVAEDDPTLLRALEGHVELQALAARLARDVEDGEAAPAVLRLVGARLHQHIRLEERELFPLLEPAAAA